MRTTSIEPAPRGESTSRTRRPPARWIPLGIILSALGLAGCDPHGEVRVNATKVVILNDHPGTGKPVKTGDVVCIDYRVETEDGDEIMWGKEFCYELGREAVIAGFDEGVIGMRVGGRRTVRCPPHKHWGAGGYGQGRIPPRTTLVLKVKLTELQSDIGMID